METEQSIELLKPCYKGVKMNIWESFFMHMLQKKFITRSTEGQ